jgi:hypothetical protein
VVAAAVELDHEPQARIREVDASAPARAVAHVELPYRLCEPCRLHQDQEPPLELAGQGDIPSSAVGQEPPHERDARPSGTAEPGHDSLDCFEGDDPSA